MMQLFHRSKVQGSFYYKVVTPLGSEGFSEVSGLSMTLETSPISPLGMHRYQLAAPKDAKYENLKLKRPLISGSALSEWCRKSISSGIIRTIPLPFISVMLLNPETDSPTASWTIIGACPVKYNVSPFNAGESQVAYEEFEFTCMTFDRTY